jgi:hypothetical protein
MSAHVEVRVFFLNSFFSGSACVSIKLNTDSFIVSDFDSQPTPNMFDSIDLDLLDIFSGSHSAT